MPDSLPPPDALLSIQKAWNEQLTRTLHDPAMAAQFAPMLQLWQQLAAAGAQAYNSPNHGASSPPAVPVAGGSFDPVALQRLAAVEQRLSVLEQRLAALENPQRRGH
ncbi:MAG: hypothetical protein ACK5XX_03985 [Holosporales bacterium]